MVVNNPRALRVLYLSPWMRPLARIYSEALIASGAEVLLLTTDHHTESDAPRPYELVLETGLKKVETWPQFPRALRRTRQFAPNVVIAEVVGDPRWMAFGAGVPRVHLVHDHKSHDDFDAYRRWELALYSPWWRRSAATVALSHYVADAIDATAVVPLTSDFDEGRLSLPPFVPAEGRRDFVVIGRMYPYKNLDVCMAAWQEHLGGSGWRGDNLVLVGDGEWRGAMPDHVVWHRKSFRYEDVLEDFAHAKGSVVHYRNPTQSGVQVLSMQLGVTPIVSTEGALPEFQPPSLGPIGIDDVEGLAKAFDWLADPVHAAASGAASREHYVRHYSAEVSAHELLRVLLNVAAG